MIIIIIIFNTPIAHCNRYMMICDSYRTKVMLPTVLKLFAVNCFINNLTSIKRSKR